MIQGVPVAGTSISLSPLCFAGKCVRQIEYGFSVIYFLHNVHHIDKKFEKLISMRSFVIFYLSKYFRNFSIKRLSY